MLSKQDLLDLQFIEAHHKLIDLAAFLDRINRHPGAADYRFDALKSALSILIHTPHLEDKLKGTRLILDSLANFAQLDRAIPHLTRLGYSSLSLKMPFGTKRP